MDDHHPPPDPATSWLASARDDLRVATAVLDSEIGVEWAACFHAQQTAEKALKGLLAHLSIDFPKTHRLDRLVALMPEHLAIQFDPESLIALTPWAVAGRYPDDITPPTSHEARRIVQLAADVLAAADTAITL